MRYKHYFIKLENGQRYTRGSKSTPASRKAHRKRMANRKIKPVRADSNPKVYTAEERAAFLATRPDLLA